MRRALRIAAVTVSHRILKNVGVGYPAPYKVLSSSHQSWFSPEKTNFDGNLVRLCTLALSACGGVVKVPVENFFAPRGENPFCPCPRQLGRMARVGGTKPSAARAFIRWILVEWRGLPFFEGILLRDAQQFCYLRGKSGVEKLLDAPGGCDYGYSI